MTICVSKIILCADSSSASLDKRMFSSTIWKEARREAGAGKRLGLGLITCRNPGGLGCGFTPLSNKCPTGIPGKAIQGPKLAECELCGEKNLSGF